MKKMMTVVACTAAFAALSAEMPKRGICAHRGDRCEFPENTVPAFLSAVKKGAAMVEFDVTRCATGELVVMHDPTIDRTTTGTGAVERLTFDYLRSVDAGVKRGERFRGVRIPTFDEAIDCFPEDGVWLNVHCKSEVTDEVARKIREKGRLHQAFIAAGSNGVARARAAVPEVHVCLFSGPEDSWSRQLTTDEVRSSIAEALDAKADFIQPHYAQLAPDMLYAFHAAGGKVNYFWCNKPELLPVLMAGGVDFPLTDNLDAMQKAFKELGFPAVPDAEQGFDYVGDFVRKPATGLVGPNGLHDRRRRKFAGIPSVAISPKNGRLWRTWYGGPAKAEDRNNYAILATSADGGRTWKEVLFRDPDQDGPWRAFDPEVWIAPNGKLWWTWTERETAVNGNWMVHRHIAGSTWVMGAELDAENEPSEPYPVPRRLAPGVMMCKPIATKDGRWLLPCSVWGDDLSARVYESRDAGRTFDYLGGVHLPSANREFDEHNLVELADSTLRIYQRVAKGNGHGIWQSESKDGGRTWNAPRPCSFTHTNSRAFVRRLVSGALLLVKNGSLDYTFGGKDYHGRTDMYAYVSDDDGATWTGGLRLHKGPCSYPDGDQASDGTILVIFDNDRYGKQELHLRKFTEADVRKGGVLQEDVL
ncbi:MAG: exo-alpha-sialidase [bacterium]|nr:exo-alpha-sialidase [Candidatus Colisoma equi]